MINLKHIIVIALVVLGFMATTLFVAFDEMTLPESDTIMVYYGDDENYFILANDQWRQRDNGVKENNDPYDYIMMEDHLVFYTNKHITQVELFPGDLGEIEYVNDAQFIYWAYNELPDQLALKITY